ncbi:MAG TPA: Spy/CpxP family protein refolding chaperone [Bryobacteraceae bacterium]
MQIFSSKLSAWSAVAALGAVSLFAQAPQADGRAQGRHKLGRVANYLNLTAAQRAQAQTIFREAGQSAKPVRQQLRETRKSLQAAIKTGNSDQIQQLSATEGNERGQLAAIRANAFAKLYPALTPEQQQKLAEFRHSRKRG